MKGAPQSHEAKESVEHQPAPLSLLHLSIPQTLPVADGNHAVMETVTALPPPAAAVVMATGEPVQVGMML